MSIEFVDPPEPAPATAGVAAPAVRPSPVVGRLVGAAGVVAAALAGVAMLLPLYDVRRTQFIPDFDGTTSRTALIPYDAFGHGGTVPIAPVVHPETVGSAFSSELSISLGDSVSYAPWWLGVAGVLVVVGLWGLLRGRSPAPAVVLAVVGALLAGSLGAAWLAIRQTSNLTVPQLRYEPEPAAGLWLLVAAAGVAVVAGLGGALRPRLSRLRARRFRRG